MRTRPAGGVVLVGVLAWISGILQLFAGVFMLIAGSHPVTGWLHLLVGVVTFPVCLGIFRARGAARVVVTIVFLFEIAAVVFALTDLRFLATPAVTAAVLAVFGLVLLYTPSANASFRQATAQRRGRAAPAR
ncbi:hypothetical protein AAIB33_12835 [Microbacterium sp. AZCO]|uniref:hypothetical protein n=1 Tax=Microbacterium sp. AZCO TaxID=3142976 RepID=UPI0031F3A11B